MSCSRDVYKLSSINCQFDQNVAKFISVADYDPISEIYYGDSKILEVYLQSRDRYAHGDIIFAHIFDALNSKYKVASVHNG